MKKAGKKQDIRKWVWQSYLKSALIPIVVIEMLFFIVNLSAHAARINTMTDYLTTQVAEELSKASNQDSINIDQQLVDINYLTSIYARQTAEALSADAALSSEDAARLIYSPSGSFYTKYDAPNGGAAVFYTGYIPVGEAEREKVARVLQTQSLMKNIQTQQPLVASIYLNTCDSLNIIYPYFDVISQYAVNTDITTFNFYYEADSEHNPDRGVEWTDVYLDPAGQGWMASCIAPVYNGDFLAGVVGLDITVSDITQQVLDLHIPWEGYAMLVSSDGTILALPESGEADWGLSELTNHHYAEAILQDTYKPEEFNINNMENINNITGRLTTDKCGLTTITLNGQQKVVAWDTINETGWRLMYVVPESTIYAGVDQINSDETRSEIIISSSLFLFYILFFLILYKRSRDMSSNISGPLIAINNMVTKIGEGRYHQKNIEFNVSEFQDTSDQIIEMGERLGNINEELLNTQMVLKSREEYLQALINSIDDVILEVDENGVFKNVRTSDPNNLAVKYISDSKNTISSIMSETEADMFSGVIREVINTGKPNSLEYELETPQGIRWFQARIALIGESRLVAVSARDITGRKDMEHMINEARNLAEKANQAKTQFLSNMSHELRTPLNAVLGFAQILEIDMDYPLNKKQQECVTEIKNAGNHLLQLIKEILDLSKIEQGRMSLTIETVSISEIFSETVSLIKPIADRRGININSDYSECNQNIKTDKVRIKQVLINLLSNAVKYNKQSGKVAYYCKSVKGHIQFHVVDTGIGIPEGELENIFKPFTRIAGANNIVEGTGIGLALVKNILDMIGGSIHVESKVGEGSHFYIELPITIQDNSDNETINLPNNLLPNLKKQTKRKLLYVEDNPANMSLMNRIISYIPEVELLSAPTAEIGIDIACTHPIDLILLDINLPGMDGYQMFENLKRKDETKNTPVIAISANAMEFDIKKAMDFGFAGYFVKPIDVPSFIEKLKNVLGKNEGYKAD